MIKSYITTKQTYQVPDMAVVVITPKRCILASNGSNSLNDLDYNDIFDEDFED